MDEIQTTFRGLKCPLEKGITDTVDSTDSPGLFRWAECRVACTSKVHSLALASVFSWGQCEGVEQWWWCLSSVLSWKNPGSWGTAGPSLCDELEVHTAFGCPCTQLLQKRRAFSRYLSLSLWQPAGCVGTAFWANSVVLWSSAMTHVFPAPVSCGLSFWDFDEPRAALEDAGAHLLSICLQIVASLPVSCFSVRNGVSEWVLNLALEQAGKCPLFLMGFLQGRSATFLSNHRLFS